MVQRRRIRKIDLKQAGAREVLLDIRPKDGQLRSVLPHGTGGSDMLTFRSLSTDFPRIVHDLDRDVASLRRRPVSAEECYLQGRVTDRKFRESASIPRAHTDRYRVKNYIVIWFWDMSHWNFAMSGIHAGTTSAA